ncbi:MAG: homocysteine S-methyltransferase family protein [Oscillospiraceae bacterium]|jgi:5-methyltetrahydrofolate--homocysteine methyltransferase|nr:homocysteine S-methyltransferase family protein [Oscillospiraceae bacterium]
MLNIAEWVRRGAVVTDGAMGTMLQGRGLPPGERTEVWNLTRPAEIVRLHAEYLRAGAMLAVTNTFGVNRLKYPANGAYALRDVIFAAVRHLRTAMAETGREVPVLLSVGPTGRLPEPFGDLPFDEAFSVFKESVALGAEAGADAVLVETCTSTAEAKAAVLAAKEAAPGLPVLCTVTIEETGRLLSGATPEAAAVILEGLGVAALGINCGAGPARAKRVLPDILAAARVPVIAKPNAGLPRTVGGRTVFDLSPEAFAAQAEELLEMGAAILGGCCGSTPEHIAALARRCAGRAIPPLFAPAAETVAGPREVLALTPGEDPDLELYDPDDIFFGPVAVEAEDPAALEDALRRLDGKPLIRVPAALAETARALAETYGGVVRVKESPFAAPPILP